MVRIPRVLRSYSSSKFAPRVRARDRGRVKG